MLDEAEACVDRDKILHNNERKQIEREAWGEECGKCQGGREKGRDTREAETHDLIAFRSEII